MLFSANLLVYVIDIQTYKRLHIHLTTSIFLVDTMRAVILVRHPEQLALGIDDIALETEQARSFHIHRKKWECISENMQIYRYHWID